MLSALTSRWFLVLSVIVLLSTAKLARTQEAPSLPIIPGAAGFGVETPAGSGRHLDPPRTQVIKVTNLKTEGPGSLRAALEAEGPRVVVFEVSGNIDFTPLGNLTVKHPYLTIAGQTAPSPGITIKGCQVHVNADDVLIQHLRFRVGDLRDPTRPEVDEKSGWSQWSERDNMKVGGDRVVIDHCSFSWATDENVQSRGSNLTFRRNIFSECLNSPKHHKGGHSKGLLVLKQGVGEGQNVAVVGNLFAHNADRNPSASAGVSIAIINNLVYGANEKPAIAMTLQNAPRRGDTHGGGARASVIGIHVDNTPCMIRFIARKDEEVGQVYFRDLLYSYSAPDGKHVEENFLDPWNAPPMKIFKEWVGETVYPERSKVSAPPIVVPGLKIRPSGDVREWVLANAGARPADRDPVDERIVREVRARTGKIPASQTDVGGWPELAKNHRELNVPENPSGDDDGDGYTNLEEWLHTFAFELEGAESP